MSDLSTLVLYHGTDDRAAETILKEGFRGGFLTQCQEQAAYYADTAADDQGGEPRVLRLAVSVALLGIDDPSVEEPLGMVWRKHGFETERDYHEALSNEELAWPESWQESLAFSDCVLCTGPVSAAAIESL